MDPMKKTKLVSSLDEVQSKEVVGYVQGQEFQIGPKNLDLHNSTSTTHKKVSYVRTQGTLICHIKL
jgi:hypothetical protein